MPSVKSKINPLVLKWWREQLGLDINFIAKKLGKKVEIFEMWEAGSDSPTMSQLAKIAKVYNTNLTVFYLPAPPNNIKPNINYRGIDTTIDPATKYKLEIHIGEALRRTEIAKNLYADLGITMTTLPIMNKSLGVEGVANKIRGFLGSESSIDSETFRGKTVSEVIKFWKSLIENKDIIISQTSSMNTHIGVPTSVMRGFCITGEGVPLIMINSKDSPRGKIFTILHELVHILIGGGSEIQNIDFRDFDNPNLDPEEVFCNKVASEILVPKENFMQKITSSDFELSTSSVIKLARGYGVSEEVIMRKLLDNDIIPKAVYENFRAENKKYWEEKAPENSKAIIPPYRKIIAANGNLFTNLTLTAYHMEKIDLLNVGRFLGTNLSHLQKIEHAIYS